ncbi:metallophosphoesterase family protein [Acinetobacter sp. TYF_19]|uniref:metallophosphoesterase family protein n=1 Tax=Acinetobacter sp. TYF_19 TaxID=3367196 RepID=UPI00370B0F82
MNIIHLTDLHFDPQTNLQALMLIKDHEFFSEIDTDTTYLVITGDVATKGQDASFDFARPFIKELFIDTNIIKRSNIIICPGNHDFVDQDLTAFNDFARYLRNDSIFRFGSDSVIIKRVDDVCFCSLNSMYRYDRSTSSVDINSLRLKLERNKEAISSARHRVALLHHHIIGIEENDPSTVRNAIPLIQLLEKYNFNLILHGHQHIQLNFYINKLQVICGRSLLSQSNFLSNGFNKISYDNEQQVFVRTSYELSADSDSVGQLSLKKSI